MPRMCVAIVTEILEELYIKYEGYFSILVFIIDSYSLPPSVIIYVYTHVCMYVCMNATFCCHSISTPQSQTQTVVPCRNISTAVP
jgi:hypothetical protein